MFTRSSVVVLDSGSGNLNAIKNILGFMGENCRISRDINELRSAKMVVIPGVGSFDSIMGRLKERGLDESILSIAKKGVPILGICLGAQVLFEGSREGMELGLGLIKGNCEPLAELSLFKPNLSLNVGWSEINQLRDGSFQGSLTGLSFYFSHSFYLNPSDESNVSYDIKSLPSVPAIVEQENLIGIQFHPEKSNRAGIVLFKSLIKRFS